MPEGYGAIGPVPRAGAADPSRAASAPQDERSRPGGRLVAALVEQGQKSVAWGDLGRLLDGR